MLQYKILVYVIFSFHFLSAFSQKEDGIRVIKESGSTSLSFEKTTYSRNIKIPFKEIIVFDKRFDTSKIGYTNFNHKIQLQNSFSTILNNYFKDNLDPVSDRSLIIFIKSFWLQKGVIDNILDKKIIEKSMLGKTDPTLNMDNSGSCTTYIEVYSKSDSTFKALFKIDTFFISSKNFRRNTIEEFFFLPFDSIAKRIALTNIQELLEKKKAFSWKQVNEYYNSRFNIPILNDSSIKKGIFLSFDDFRQNKPMETDFRFSNGKTTDELYTVSNGKENLVVKYWGFYDGKDLFIRAGLSAFKAVRQQNTFEVFGAKHVSNYHNNPQQNDLRLVSFGVDRKILQVNMDTGNLY